MTLALLAATHAAELPFDHSTPSRPQMTPSTTAVPYRPETPAEIATRERLARRLRNEARRARRRAREEAKKAEEVRQRQVEDKKRLGTGQGIPLIPNSFLDNTRSLLSDNIVGLANRMDSFFGDQRADDELNRSGLRLFYGQVLRDEKKSDEDVVVRFNLRLPKLEDKFRFDFKKNGTKDKKIDEKLRERAAKAEAAGHPLSEEQLARERLRLQTDIYEPWRFRTDIGVVASIPPRAFTRARLRKNWQLMRVVPRFVEQIGFYSDRGFIQETSMNFDYTISEGRVLLRFENTEEWRLARKEVLTGHGPVLLYKTSDDDAWAYSAKVFSAVNGPWFLSNYQLAVNYRRNLRGQWLYGNVIPALDFPKYESFRRSASITLRIEALFGRR
jgi:hypothetical protein